MKQYSPQVELAMNKICAQGCELVSAYSMALIKDQSRPEFAPLDAAQRATPLFELQAIMGASMKKRIPSWRVPRACARVPAAVSCESGCFRA